MVFKSNQSDKVNQSAGDPNQPGDLDEHQSADLIWFITSLFT